jgi:hypothetical protein
MAQRNLPGVYNVHRAATLLVWVPAPCYIPGKTTTCYQDTCHMRKAKSRTATFADESQSFATTTMRSSLALTALAIPLLVGAHKEPKTAEELEVQRGLQAAAYYVRPISLSSFDNT